MNISERILNVIGRGTLGQCNGCSFQQLPGTQNYDSLSANFQNFHVRIAKNWVARNVQRKVFLVKKFLRSCYSSLQIFKFGTGSEGSKKSS